MCEYVVSDTSHSRSPSTQGANCPIRSIPPTAIWFLSDWNFPHVPLIQVDWDWFPCSVPLLTGGGWSVEQALALTSRRIVTWLPMSNVNLFYIRSFFAVVGEVWCFWRGAESGVQSPARRIMCSQTPRRRSCQSVARAPELSTRKHESPKRPIGWSRGVLW